MEVTARAIDQKKIPYENAVIGGGFYPTNSDAYAYTLLKYGTNVVIPDYIGFLVEAPGWGRDLLGPWPPHPYSTPPPSSNPGPQPPGHPTPTP